MSVEAINAVFERSNAKGSRRLVLIALANFADANGDAWPSVERLARMTNMGARNAGYCIADLETEGELTVARNKGPRGCNLYRIECIGWAERPKSKAQRGAIPCTPASLCTPARTFRKGVQASAPEPSLNHQEEEGTLTNVRVPAADAAAGRLADTGAQGMTIVQAPEPPAPTATRQPTAIQALVDAFIEATGDTTTPYSRHVRVAKDLARAGRTPEDVIGCHRWIMADPGKRALLAGKPYTLTTVGKFMHAYLTDTVPLAHVQACYVAILTGLGLEADDLTTDIQGDYWSAARQAVTAGAEPSDVRAAVGAALTSNRANPNLPPSARMVAAALAGVRSRQRQVVTR